MNPLELYLAYLEAESVSLKAQIAAKCKVLIMEDRGHQYYLAATKYINDEIRKIEEGIGGY